MWCCLLLVAMQIKMERSGSVIERSTCGSGRVGVLEGERSGVSEGGTEQPTSTQHPKTLDGERPQQRHGATQACASRPTSWVCGAATAGRLTLQSDGFKSANGQREECKVACCHQHHRHRAHHLLLHHTPRCITVYFIAVSFMHHCVFHRCMFHASLRVSARARPKSGTTDTQGATH